MAAKPLSGAHPRLVTVARGSRDSLSALLDPQMLGKWLELGRRVGVCGSDIEGPQAKCNGSRPTKSAKKRRHVMLILSLISMFQHGATTCFKYATPDFMGNQHLTNWPAINPGISTGGESTWGLPHPLSWDGIEEIAHRRKIGDFGWLSDKD